jgi:hypothetical protein
VIRHTVLFAWADDVTDEQLLRAKEGMAACYFASGVLALDYGSDLGLAPTKYGLCLVHDHRDRIAWDDYNKNEQHHRAGEYIKSISKPELAARVDWPYAGPLSQRGRIRHTALYRWRDGIGKDEQMTVRDSLVGLRSLSSVVAVEYGDDLGWYPPNLDWIEEIHFESTDEMQSFFANPARRETERLIAAATIPEATAQVQHRILAG